MSLVKELFIFDIDGVLFNSESLVIEAVFKAVIDFEKESGYRLRLPSREKILSGVGLPNDLFIENLGLNVSDEEKDLFKNLLIASEVSLMKNGKGNLCPGMKDVLEYLYNSGKKLAIGSGCKREYLISFLETFSLEDFFEISICGDDIAGRDKKEILEMVLEHQEMFPSEAVYIGDTVSDYFSAKALNVDFIGVLWGYGKREDFPEGVELVSTLDELKNLLYNLI